MPRGAGGWGCPWGGGALWDLGGVCSPPWDPKLPHAGFWGAAGHCGEGGSHTSPPSSSQFLPVQLKVGPGKAPCWGGAHPSPFSPPGWERLPLPHPIPSNPPQHRCFPPFLSGSPFLPGFLTPPSSAQFNPVQPSPVRRVLLAPVPAFVPPRRGGALLSPAVDSALGPPAPSGGSGGTPGAEGPRGGSGWGGHEPRLGVHGPTKSPGQVRVGAGVTPLPAPRHGKWGLGVGFGVWLLSRRGCSL